MLLHFPTLAAPAILAPFPSIWRPFSPCPVLTPVQKFNAIKQPPFRFRCKLLTFTDFVDLLSGGITARIWEIVEIWGVSVRNTAYSTLKHCSYSPQNRVRNGECCSIWIIFINCYCIFEKSCLSLHQQPTQTGSRSFKWFSARLAPALVPLLELVRARIRNTRGIENGILLHHDTNTIEALAALHIPAPHMMHTESRNKPTEETTPHPSRYDEKGLAGIGTRIT